MTFMRSTSVLSSRAPASYADPSLAPNWTPAALLSTLLYAAILMVGPCVLGGVRPWIELPILGGVAVLLLLQGLRLLGRGPLGNLRQIDAIDLAVLLFVIYAVSRWLTSPTEYYSRFEALGVVGYATIFFFARYGLPQRSAGIFVLILLVGLGVGEVVFGYLLRQHSNAGDPASLWFPFGETEQMQLFWAPRWLGTYGCPNHYACLLVMATGATLVLACFSRFSWPVRIVFFYFTAILLAGIVFSLSRGSWLSLLGVLAALTFIALRAGSIRWWLPVAGLAVMATLLAGIFITSKTVRGRAQEVGDILSHGGVFQHYLRVDLTRNALLIAHDHPIFGTGPATYNFVDPRYQSNALAVRAVYTHDDYLNCLDDYGLIGFALAMFFVFAVTLSLCARTRTAPGWRDRVLVGAALTAWAALLVHSFLDFNMHIPANAMLLFALAGMGLRRRADEEAPHHWSTVSLHRLGPAVGWTLIIFSLLEGAEIVRTALSDFPYESAAAQANFVSTAQSIRGVEKALSYDPGNVAALVLLGDLHRVRASRADDPTARMAEAQEALTAYQAAWRGNPLDDSVQARLGLTYNLMQRYSEAFLCFQAATRAQPYNGQFWKALGSFLFERGLLDKAQQAFATAATCPHGNENAAEYADKLRQILSLNQFLPPDTNPPAPDAGTEP